MEKEITFDDILGSYLDAIDANPEGELTEDEVTRISAEFGVADQMQSATKEADEFFKQMQLDYEALQKCKEEGYSREAWLESNLDNIAQKAGMDDTQKLQFYQNMIQGMGKRLEELLDGKDVTNEFENYKQEED